MKKPMINIFILFHVIASKTYFVLRGDLPYSRHREAGVFVLCQPWRSSFLKPFKKNGLPRRFAALAARNDGVGHGLPRRLLCALLAMTARARYPLGSCIFNN